MDSFGGSLIQTTARFRFDSPLIHSTLAEVFSYYFAQSHQGDSTGNSGFEVVVTFNAVLFCESTGTYSLFYGVDHRATNDSGVAPELKYGDSIVVRNLSEVSLLPTSFDAESLVNSHRHNFESSNLRIHSLLNVVFLIYRFVTHEVRGSQPSLPKKKKGNGGGSGRRGRSRVPT